MFYDIFIMIMMIMMVMMMICFVWIMGCFKVIDKYIGDFGFKELLI